MAAGDGREAGSVEGWRVIEAAVDAARGLLGDALISAYAIGSLGHGGFEAASSDVDLALLTSADAGEVPVGRIRLEVERDLDGPLAKRLSVFHVAWPSFASPPPGSRFPPLDRQDLRHSGVLLFGEDLRERFGTEPDSAEVLKQAVSAALARDDAASLRTKLEELTPVCLDGRTASKIVLWPVRLLYVAATGDAAGAVDAAAHYRDATPPPQHLALVEAALSWRRMEAIPDADAALEMLRAETLPLHAEIYARLAPHPGLPQAEELASRAAAFADAARSLA